MTLNTYRASLGKWALDISKGRRTSGLAVELSRSLEKQNGQLEEYSLHVPLGNLRGLSTDIQSQGGELVALFSTNKLSYLYRSSSNRNAGLKGPDRPEIPFGIPYVELTAAIWECRGSGVVHRSHNVGPSRNCTLIEAVDDVTVFRGQRNRGQPNLRPRVSARWPSRNEHDASSPNKLRESDAAVWIFVARRLPEAQHVDEPSNPSTGIVVHE